MCCLNDAVADVGSEADTVVFGDNAEEDSELRAQRPREAGDGQRGPRWRGKPRRHPGGGVRQNGREDDLHPCLSAEDLAAGNRPTLAYLLYAM